ncbi:MAG: L,D-transpeptidase family protein [Bacteroidetes bacterium]|nr:L,D-transpeptidase family protein [Bacteroidota bacterium]
MQKITSILILTFIVVNVFAQSDFLTEQKRYKRVRTSIIEKEKVLINKLKETDIGLDELNIMILAYKTESEIEIFAKKKTEKTYKKLTKYNVCSKSGKLGPKRKQGDYQVPEGFYFIDRFNPASSFYLSLGINYPNQSDRIKSNATNLGGDIFIHGNCVTIGCLPMTDDKIKEIYLYAINAKNNGQKRIPVYIFPFRMTKQNFEKYTTKYNNNTELIDFWTNIKSGYDKFEKERKELNISINKKGDYSFQ